MIYQLVIRISPPSTYPPSNLISDFLPVAIGKDILLGDRGGWPCRETERTLRTLLRSSLRRGEVRWGGRMKPMGMGYVHEIHCTSSVIIFIIIAIHLVSNTL